MFHDGRVAVDPTQPSGFLSSAGGDLPQALLNVLAVQAGSGSLLGFAPAPLLYPHCKRSGGHPPTPDVYRT